jgi:hypothetical protein
MRSMIFSIVTTLVLWCLSIDTDTQLILFEMCRFVLFLFQTSLIQMYEPTVNMYNINTIGNIIVWRHHSVKVLYHLFSFVLHWRAGYQEGRVKIPLTCLTPPHFCVCPKPGIDFQRHIFFNFFYVQWVEMRGDCSFCWYWWPSLFKLSFHNLLLPLNSACFGKKL